MSSLLRGVAFGKSLAGGGYVAGLTFAALRSVAIAWPAAPPLACLAKCGDTPQILANEYAQAGCSNCSSHRGYKRMVCALPQSLLVRPRSCGSRMELTRSC